ncbi:DUF3299 domain-containing protein [Vibrio splendidus]|uniref:DUF3299 domain-containing protein n=1 Tax=Vibrio splendidus TaxID=29497 RepID=UPI000C83B89D|nr:DUF3299 domain-containing protein [Vibrio splendidus]PMI75900.1 hypothetical protein BCU38_08745 [Vibrio splendidus]
MLFRFSSLFTTLLPGLLLSFSAMSSTMVMWEDLIPPPTKEVALPALNQDQVSNLFAVLSYQKTILKREMNSEETEQYEASKLALSESGYDADELLALREEALAVEHIRLTTVNTDLELNDVTIPGFVVPLEMDGMLTTKFLLVPIAGACIHTPPPPANQTIIVDIDEGFPLQDLYRVVMVSGDIATFEQDLPISFIDGTEVISTGYSMVAHKVNYPE